MLITIWACSLSSPQKSLSLLEVQGSVADEMVEWGAVIKPLGDLLLAPATDRYRHIAISTTCKFATSGSAQDQRRGHVKWLENAGNKSACKETTIQSGGSLVSQPASAAFQFGCTSIKSSQLSLCYRNLTMIPAIIGLVAKTRFPFAPATTTRSKDCIQVKHLLEVLCEHILGTGTILCL